MKLTIHNNRKVFAIQQTFTKEFPHLHLQFAAKASRASGPASSKIAGASHLLAQCRNTRNNGVLTISKGMTAHDVENIFRNSFGLSVQVLRSNEKGQSAISSSDKRSLEELNAETK